MAEKVRRDVEVAVDHTLDSGQKLLARRGLEDIARGSDAEWPRRRIGITRSGHILYSFPP